MKTTVTNDRCYEFRGLAADRLAMTDDELNFISNGSIFFEIDTIKVYVWDAENKIWRDLTA